MVGWAAGSQVALRWAFVLLRGGSGPAADCGPEVRQCRPPPHRSCLGSPRREKSEDAYVQGDSAGAPSDLRLSGLSNILPGGEMWEKVGASGSFLSPVERVHIL